MFTEGTERGVERQFRRQPRCSQEGLEEEFLLATEMKRKNRPKCSAPEEESLWWRAIASNK